MPEADADERQDSILWAHILLMMLSFGIIFPAGMVLGVSGLFWDGGERLIIATDCSESMACTNAGIWDGGRCCCVFPGTHARRESLHT